MIDSKTTKNCAILWYEFKGEYPSEMFFEFTEVFFEDFKCKTMLKYHDYLTLTYGDYMTPPKEEDRCWHEISLGEIYMDVNTDFRVYKRQINNK